MNAQRRQLFSPIFLFSVTLLIPLFILGLSNGNKLLQIYVTQKQKFQITKSELISNDHRKYNNHASYRFTYNGKQFTGSDGSIQWGLVGNAVTVYFEKNTPDNNGIISELIFCAVGQWLLFIILGTYISIKIIKNARTP